MMFLYKQSMQFQSSLTGMQRFFSIMAHDLRSPVGTIAMIAGELQKNDKRDPEDQKQLIESMKDSSINTFNLLEDLLEWGRNMIGDLHPQPTGFSLNKLLNEEIDLAMPQAQTKQINISRDFASELFVFADENMIHTIARNLLSNAIKFTQESGSVIVFTEQNGRESSFTVMDSGIGMSQKVLRQITETNFVASHSGTNGEQGYGLGLSFCQNLVEVNHGELSIHSELGKGTSIKIKLPAFHEGHGKH
jgi:signal transduction histidine kinase